MNRGLHAYTGPRLSALMVNYNTGAFAFEAARSLRREWHAAGFAPEKLELIVVDNASPRDQHDYLDALELEGAQVLSASENIGYAGAVQLALGVSKGHEDDYIAILNADIHFLPGSVRTLIHYLQEHPECGAIAPRAFIDEGCQLQLPYVPLPGAIDELGLTLARCSPTIGRWTARMQQRHALSLWRADAPCSLKMLSGACLFLPRAVLGPLSGMLLDPRYPLYYEDADLCRRLKRKHFDLVYQPHAQILHHWSRSAGAGEEFMGEPQKRWEAARRAYFGRHLGRVGSAAVKGAQRIYAKLPPEKRDRPIHEMENLGEFEEACSIELPEARAVLIELAMTPAWTLAAGHLTQGGLWTFPTAAWSWLFDGRYFARATDLSTGKLIGAWTFVKGSFARNEPVPDGMFSIDEQPLLPGERSYSDQIWGESA